MLQSDYMAERDTSVAKNAGGRNYFDSQSKTQDVDYNRKYQQENYGNKNLSGNRKNILAQKDTFCLKEWKCKNEGGPQEFSGKGTVDMNYFLNCLQDLDINVDNLRPQQNERSFQMLPVREDESDITQEYSPNRAQEFFNFSQPIAHHIPHMNNSPSKSSTDDSFAKRNNLDISGAYRGDEKVLNESSLPIQTHSDSVF